MEREIDSKTELYRANQVYRMRNKKCQVEASILYSEILTDYERIGDHARNIAEEYHQMGQV